MESDAVEFETFGVRPGIDWPSTRDPDGYLPQPVIPRHRQRRLWVLCMHEAALCDQPTVYHNNEKRKQIVGVKAKVKRLFEVSPPSSRFLTLWASFEHPFSLQVSLLALGLTLTLLFRSCDGFRWYSSY
jgi:hypothetical protein